MSSTAYTTLQQHLIEALGSPPDEARRLFHGRGRLWPGLEQITVDWLQGIVLVALFFLGGDIIHDFSFAMLVGVVVGTYSSIYVASPIVLSWEERAKKK